MDVGTPTFTLNEDQAAYVETRQRTPVTYSSICLCVRQFWGVCGVIPREKNFISFQTCDLCTMLTAFLCKAGNGNLQPAVQVKN